MAYKIIITNAFEKASGKTSKWIETNWSLASSKKFDKKIIDTITSISLNPNIGRKTRRKNIRSQIITKHNRIYYRFSLKTITILTLFENKMDPQKNKYE